MRSASMPKYRLLAVVLTIAAITAIPAHAGLFNKSPEKSAEDATRANMAAATIWVDASWGFRHQGAANSLSDAHQAFAARVTRW